jgi:hypothetical protein
MYKLAVKLDLRFQTNKGILTPQQLYQLNQTDLSDAIKEVKKVLKKDNDDDLSFLENTKTVDVENQLKFDILKDVYLTKKKEAEELRNAFEVKEHNQKILTLIVEKQEGELRGKSIEELTAMLQ